MSNPPSPSESSPARPGIDWKIGRFVLMGAAGCLAGALLGEPLLLLTRTPAPKVIPQAVCLLIDCSGSMMLDSRGRALTGEKLLEVKAAASQFVNRQDLKRDMIAVVGFGGSVRVAAPLTRDPTQLNLAIHGLADGGSTAMHAALPAAAATLSSSTELAKEPATVRNILLFTDGQPDNPPKALEQAHICRQQQIKIVAIATGDAKVDYLAQLTGDPKLVFPVTAGNFGEGFKKAEEAIYGPSLVESAASRSGLGASLLKTAGWTALLAIGVSLALISGQNLYLRRQWMRPKQGILGGLGGLLAGAIGGAAGQLFFAAAVAVAGVPLIGLVFGWFLRPLGRIVGWAVLGALVGRGLAFFVPNLEPRRAWLGGVIGGGLGAVAFLFASLFGDLLGRWLGAAILGACIGMMIAWMEVMSRQWWLEVRLGQKEVVKVNLGNTPVRIGSDNRRCTIYARGVRPLAAQYRVVEGRVEYLDLATEKKNIVEMGDERIIGHVTVTVRARTGAADGPSHPASAQAAAAASAPAAPPPPTVKKAAAAEAMVSSAGGPDVKADRPASPSPASTTPPATASPVPSTPAPPKPAGQVLASPPPPKPKSPQPPGSGPAQRTIRPLPPAKP